MSVFFLKRHIYICMAGFQKCETLERKHKIHFEHVVGIIISIIWSVCFVNCLSDRSYNASEWLPWNWIAWCLFCKSLCLRPNRVKISSLGIDHSLVKIIRFHYGIFHMRNELVELDMLSWVYNINIFLNPSVFFFKVCDLFGISVTATFCYLNISTFEGYF